MTRIDDGRTFAVGPALRTGLLVACCALWGCALSGCAPGSSGGDGHGDAAADGAPAVDAGPDDQGSRDQGPGDQGLEPAPDSGLCAPRWPGAAWNEPIADAPLDARSGPIIAALRAAGGWGNGDVFQIDFSIEVLRADGDTPLRPFEPTADHFAGDCDLDPIPVPAMGALEGEDGYRCESDGDCHLIVWHQPSGVLFEMWRADIVGDVFRGGCLAVWDSARDYSAEGRGEQCTSADAAGLPIAPLLFRVDEVQAGRIEHAIRFILPNNRIRNRTYVRPATHATGAASAGEDGVPYGARLRLRADYPLEALSPGARVVAEAMQRYGMILADGGQIALTAQSDRFEAATWEGLLGPRDLAALRVEDFEVVELGERLAWAGDCVRVTPERIERPCPAGPRP